MFSSNVGRWAVASGAALAAGAIGWVPAADAATSVVCGQVITASITVANDIGPCLGDGLIVKSNYVTVDLGGHTVVGDAFNPAAAVDQAGIRVDGAVGATVKNGTVRGFFVGVLVKGGTANTVSKMTVDKNIGLGKTAYNDGIILDASRDNHVTDNTVTGNGPDAGISMINSADHNSVARNVVTGNNVVTTGQGPGGTDVNYDSGINLDTKSSFNVISDNQVLGNGFDGVSLGGLGPTSRNQAIRNTIRDNGHVGINAGGNGNFVSRNNVDRNGGGGIVTCGMGQLCGPDFTTIERNRVTANTGFGIGIIYNGSQDAPGADPPGSPFLLYAPPRSNLVQLNVVRANTGDGIYIQCDTLYDADGNGTCLPTTPPHDGMRILRNLSRGNGGAGAGVTAWDYHDENPGCGRDIWKRNVPGTANPPCTLAR